MKKLKKVLYLKLARKINKNAPVSAVPTIISEDTKVVGNIISAGAIHVDGRVEGDIQCAELVVGIKGSIKGMVKTEKLELYGTLQGKALVDDLFVAKTAKMIGDAAHNSIAIEPGAYIDGSCIRADKLHSTNTEGQLSVRNVNVSQPVENKPRAVAAEAQLKRKVSK